MGFQSFLAFQIPLCNILETITSFRNNKKENENTHTLTKLTKPKQKLQPLCIKLGFYLLLDRINTELNYMEVGQVFGFDSFPNLALTFIQNLSFCLVLHLAFDLSMSLNSDMDLIIALDLNFTWIKFDLIKGKNVPICAFKDVNCSWLEFWILIMIMIWSLVIEKPMLQILTLYILTLKVKRAFRSFKLLLGL